MARTVKIHSATVRLTHWMTALAILIMIGSGWRIYDWDPIFSWLTIPFWMTLGGERTLSQAVHNEEGLAGALQWHFAAMWLLAASFLVYVINGFVTGHFRRHFLPITPAGVFRDVKAALTGHLEHRIGERNAVQRVLYAGVSLAIALMLLSGLSIWKPVQFQGLTWLFGDYDNARIVHFLGMAAIVAFLVIHVALVVLVPKVLPPMITGRARVEPDVEPGLGGVL